MGLDQIGRKSKNLRILSNPAADWYINSMEASKYISATWIEEEGRQLTEDPWSHMDTCTDSTASEKPPSCFMDRISDLRTTSNPRCQPANKRFLSHLDAFYLAHNDINVNGTLQLSLIRLRNHLDEELVSNILVEGRPTSPLVSGFLNLFPVLEKKSCPL